MQRQLSPPTVQGRAGSWPPRPESAASSPRSAAERASLVASEALLQKWHSHYGVEEWARAASQSADAAAAAARAAASAPTEEFSTGELPALRRILAAVVDYIGTAALDVDIYSPSAPATFASLLRRRGPSPDAAGRWAAAEAELHAAELRGQGAAERAAALERRLQRAAAEVRDAQEDAAEWRDKALEAGNVQGQAAEWEQRALEAVAECDALRRAAEAASAAERGLRSALSAARAQLEQDGAAIAELGTAAAQKDAQLRVATSECRRARDDAQCLAEENERLLAQLHRLRRRALSPQSSPSRPESPPADRPAPAAEFVRRAGAAVRAGVKQTRSGGSAAAELLGGALGSSARQQRGGGTRGGARGRCAAPPGSPAAARAAARAAQRAQSAVAAQRRGRSPPQAATNPTVSSELRRQLHYNRCDVSPPHPDDPAPGLRYAYAVAPPQPIPAVPPRLPGGGGQHGPRARDGERMLSPESASPRLWGTPQRVHSPPLQETECI
eukprot:TRINITY_DN3403_c0_g1_i1.p1 TRINITY_DN3403_c0_g1~~TRINITY_DN3403_c0_g1_i1.p1  ORF type:complete len:501 (+),score=98.09 TRINITY_DN3403_c0_g1_i1:65-1567(+)